METVRLTVEGMSCEHCVRSVDGALRGVAGVQQVNVTIGDVEVGYEPDATTVDRLLEAIEEEGYIAYRTEGV